MSSSQNWGRRRLRARENWDLRMERLVDEYLAFVHSRTTSGAPAPVVYPDYGVRPEILNTRALGTVRLVDISGIYDVPTVALGGDAPLNASLLRRGYLGSSPVNPTIAFSLRILALFLRLRLRARTGKHNFARVLCDIHNIPYAKSLRDRFSAAVDALALIQRSVDGLLLGKRGRDRLWRMRNACPACAYTCEDEAPLLYVRQFAIDGNNSMKRYISAGTRHDKAYELTYLLTRQEVDRFKDEVRRGRSARRAAADGAVASDDAAACEDSECTKRWRNAAPENERARPSDVVDETGIFVCTCRHGFIVLATDMWQSGELAKYPLSVVKTLVDLFGEEGTIQIGYDIGCAHSVTAGNSSFGEQVKTQARFVVGSFHGHAHDRLCQLRFHPRYIKGSGREDFEGCERLFSVNNFIAPLIIHATRYHRHELIEASFTSWDSEKYATLGSLLLSKFVEAKAKIAEHLDDERERSRNPQYTDAYFEALLADERDFIAGRTRTEQDLNAELASEYAAMLRRWWAACAERAGLDPFIAHIPGSRDGTNRKWLAVQRRIQTCEDHLHGFEQRLGIAVHERWTRVSPEYRTTLQADNHRAYDEALDALERSVADRTAVLEKLNRRGTGYSLRRQIAKAVTRRGTAFGAALQKYNEAALALVPPRPTLTREEVENIAILAEFPLLREDTAGRPWAQPTVRRLTTAWSETARANEELIRVRIESVRLRAWIRDEEADMDRLVAQWSASNSYRDKLLAKELDARAQFLFQVHDRVLADLRRLDLADGLAGPRPAGVRAGQDVAQGVRPAVRHQQPPLPDHLHAPVPQDDRYPHERGANAPSNSSESEGGLFDEDAEQHLDAVFMALDQLAG